MLCITKHQGNTYQNHNEIPLQTHQGWLLFKKDFKQKITSASDLWSTGIFVHCWWECKMMMPWTWYGNDMEIPQKKEMVW